MRARKPCRPPSDHSNPATLLRLTTLGGRLLWLHLLKDGPFNIFNGYRLIKPSSIADSLARMEADPAADSGKRVFLYNLAVRSGKITLSVQGHDGGNVLAERAGFAARGKAAHKNRPLKSPGSCANRRGRFFCCCHGRFSTSFHRETSLTFSKAFLAAATLASLFTGAISPITFSMLSRSSNPEAFAKAPTMAVFTMLKEVVLSLSSSAIEVASTA